MEVFGLCGLDWAMWIRVGCVDYIELKEIELAVWKRVRCVK